MKDHPPPTQSEWGQLVALLEPHLEEYPLQRQASYPADFQAVVGAAEELDSIKHTITDEDCLSVHIGPLLIERIEEDEYFVSLRLNNGILVIQQGLCRDLTIDFINHFPFK